MYSIYTLSDPRDNSVRYVGLSKNAYKRYGSHLLNLESNNTPKDHWVTELLNLGILPVLNVIETVETHDMAEEREHYWIHFYLQTKVNILNVAKTTYQAVSQSATPKVTFPKLDEAKQIISSQGWIPQEQTRRKGTLYLYAGRRRKTERKGMEWRYIAPLSRLETMTAQEILAKLNK